MKDLPGNVRTLVSSRTGLGVRGLKTSQTLVITPREDDISAYVKARIESDENLLHVLTENHKIDLVARSVTGFTLKSGMFLLARLHLDTLSKCGTLKSIEDALDQLPEDLDEAFEGAINQIKNRHGFKRDLARHVLTWVVHAKDDLTVKQIEDSFAFHQSNGDSWQDSLPRKHSPVSVCAGLVVEDLDKGTLRLVHESVKRRLEGGPIIYKNADVEIAKTCLSCLLAKDSGASFDTPLLEYASVHWTHHLPNGQTVDPQMETRIRDFFLSTTKLVRAFKVIPDVPSRKLDGMTGLHAAVYYNLKSWAKTLIKSKVHVNAQCSDNQTALHWAATLGRRRLTEYLMRKGANPNLFDATGDTPIHKCLSGPALSNLDIVKFLVQGGARLDLKGAKGLTPLSTAIRYGPTSVAKLLIKNQGDLNAEIIMPGWTSLRELLYHGHDMVDGFRKSPKATRRSSADGWRPLRRAIDDHVHHLMQFILNRGVDLNRPTTQNWLPLAYAVSTGQAKMVQRLLDRTPNPADVNLRDPLSGMSLLCLALQYKKNHIARQLIKSGSDLNGTNNVGQTPLIQAVKSADRDLVWLLFKKGAQPNTLDNEGKSALHHAIEGGNKDIVWLLVTKRGGVGVQTGVIQSCFDLALEKSEFSIAWLLHEHGANINATDKSEKTALHSACIRGSLPQIRFLLDMGANINSRDAESSTPLHDSVVSGREEVVGLLASRAPHPKGLDEQDGKSNTALILATIKKNRAMVDSLLHHGASCDVQDQGGLTALHRAANQGFNDGLRALVAKAGNVNLADKKGYTALHHAVNSEEADADTVDILCTGKIDLDILQEDGYSPRGLAVALGKDAFARQLLGYERRASATHRTGNVGSRERRRAA
ncbi:hypothetical protein NW767_011157 [Fusarium falciforme]|nr:hypothetical protein NW767_011157 [Fusarium falciforme]